MALLEIMELLGIRSRILGSQENWSRALLSLHSMEYVAGMFPDLIPFADMERFLLAYAGYEMIWAEIYCIA